MKRLLMVVLLFGGCLLPVANSYAITPASEDKIVAAYIYQFTQFVSWPEIEYTEDLKFSICVFGNDPVGRELEPLNGRQIDGRKITISYPKKINETSRCNILYIAKTKKHLLRKIFKYLHDKPVLTVSSIPDFARQGGVIDFIVYKNRIRLETNITVARHANLRISAKLLEVCLKVYGLDEERGK